MRLVGFVIAVLAAGPALATNVSDELSMGRTQSTPANPRGGTLSDSLSASLTLNDQWAVSLGGMVTLEEKTPAAQRGQFGSSGNAITFLSTGVDFDPSDHVSLGVDFNLSPKSTQYSGMTLTGTETYDALVQAQSSQIGGGFDVSYDTAGDSNLEWMFSAGISGTHFETDQRIARVRTATGAAATPQQIRDYCTANPKKCPIALLKALQQLPAALNSTRLSLGATATIAQDSDITLDVDYFAYAQDPTQVGYYSVAVAGRSSLSGGNGIPLAPLRYLVRPEFVQRFGGLSVKLWVQGGHYVPSAGGTTAGGGLKVQYKLTKGFRMWLSASGQNDVDDQGNSVNSGTFALGAGYRF